MPTFLHGKKVVALAGGVGGSRLIRGMAEHLTAEQLTVIVNTGDDFEHLGFNISPDIDTVLYNLADLSQPKQGWGIKDDSFHCMTALKKLGKDTWFQLGDKDLATHILRTHWTKEGVSLTEITTRLAQRLGILHTVLPMSDQPCRTMVETDDGTFDFQTYFVKHRWQPVIQRLFWQGVESAQTTPQVIDAIANCDLVVVCPSNPFVSIDPILNLPGVRKQIQTKPVLAMSPIIGGMAVKGPAAKMFHEIANVDASVEAVADHYNKLISGIVIDEVDEELLPMLRERLNFATAMPTLMLNREKQIEIGAAFLSAAEDFLKLSEKINCE